MQGWTIYLNQKDFPGCYVTRRWEVQVVADGSEAIAHDEQPAYVGRDLAAARAAIPPDCEPFDRSTAEPDVLEVWI
jgi:hypothetical protein